MTRATRMALAATALLAAVSPAPAQTPDHRPLGTWTRRADGNKVTLTAEPDRLRCTVQFKDGFTISVSADYVVSKDGVLLGVLRPRGAAPDPSDQKATEDRLFFCRVVVDGDKLTVSGLTVANDDAEVNKLIEGRYKRAEVSAGSTTSRATKVEVMPKVEEPGSDHERIMELLNQCEDIRGGIRGERKRIFFKDEPPPLKLDRVHGGIQP